MGDKMNLDTPLTIRDIIPASYMENDHATMTWEEYCRLPAGLNEAREKRFNKYRFVGYNTQVPCFGIPMVATFMSASPTDDGIIEHWDHHPVAIDGKELVMKRVRTNNWKCHYGALEFTP